MLKQQIVSNLLVVFLMAGLVSCSSVRNRPDATQEQTTRIQELHDVIGNLNEKIQTLESKVATLDDQVRAAQVKPIAPKASEKAVVVPPSSNWNPPVTEVDEAPKGFENGEIVQRYRKAKLYYDSEKWNEAILEFSAFLRDFADHTLAASAQFYIGESYLRQKEYRLALEEYQRVLISYDDSSYVPDSLARVVHCQEKLSLLQEAQNNRQLLSAFFPQAPATLALAPAQPHTGAPKTENEVIETAPVGHAGEHE